LPKNSQMNDGAGADAEPFTRTTPLDTIAKHHS